MITIRPDQAIVCQVCDLVVLPDPITLQGCGCDPDAPTWVAIQPDGNLLAFSQANYEIVTGKIDPRNEQFLRGLIGDQAYEIIEESDGLK